MKTSEFDFYIPNNLIADRPHPARDESKLMIIHKKTGKIEHKLFKDIIYYFHNNDVFILNNTKVIPARFYGKKEKTDAEIEVFLLRELDRENKIIDVLVEPARKIRIGNKIIFKKKDVSLLAEVIDNTTSRGRTLKFISDASYEEFKKKIRFLGKTPLPKYITREVEKNDIERYQTIYAKKEGSVAAPSAGLHFTKDLLKKLELIGVFFTEITLHLGLGSFYPLGVEDISKYNIDSEHFIVEQTTCDIINNSLIKKKRICAVGISSLRAIESAVLLKKKLFSKEGWTNKFFYPPYDFSIVNCLITNFHMPKSPFLIMTSAFAGYELIMEAYDLAIKKKYRFYSYGDAMLILND